MNNTEVNTLIFRHRSYQTDSCSFAVKLVRTTFKNDHSPEILNSLVPFNLVDSLDLRYYSIEFIFVRTNLV